MRVNYKRQSRKARRIKMNKVGINEVKKKNRPCQHVLVRERTEKKCEAQVSNICGANWSRTLRIYMIGGDYELDRFSVPTRSFEDFRKRCEKKKTQKEHYPRSGEPWVTIETGLTSEHALCDYS